MESDAYVARLRDTLLNDTLLWLGIVSLPMVALSVSRITMMGWRPVFGLQLLLLSLVWLFWFQRHHIAYFLRLGTFLFVMGAAGLTAYIQYGPAAVAGQLLLLFLVITVVFTDGRAAIGLGLLILVGLLLTAWGAVSGTLQFQIDYTSYAHNPVNWVLIILAFAGCGGIVALLVRRLFRGLIGHQKQLMQANAKLARSTEELLAHQIELEAHNESLRQSKAELEAMRALYFELYNLAPVGYFTISKNGLILQANLTATAMLDTAREALVGQPINRLILKEDQDVFHLNRMRIFESGEPRSFELRLAKHDSTLFWVRLTASVAQSADGAPELRITLSDITEHKRIEASLRTLTQATEQSPASIVITDRTGSIEYVNPGFEELTGYARGEVLGGNPRILRSGLTPAQTYSQLWKTISAGGTWRGELCNRRKNGELFWEAASISGLKDETGQVTHYIAVKENITERKAALDELWQARRREIEIGSTIQRTLLQGKVPGGIEGAWLATHADPSQIIDGDFYTIRRYRPACFELLVGDVMGKGVPAALIGAGILTSYSNLVSDLLVAGSDAQTLPTPAQIVNAMHRVLTPELIKVNTFATLALYRFDLDAGTLTYVNAGHTPGLLTRESAPRPVAILGDNLPIGVIPEEEYVQSSIAVGPGDRLLIYSDGITESLDEADEEFGLERLSGLFEAGSRADLPPATLLQSLRGELRRFNGGRPLTDDQTALVVALHERRVQPRGQIADRVKPFVFDLPWCLDELASLPARIGERAGHLLAEDADALFLASFEAATNIIRHARLLIGDATITCRITREDEALTVELIYPSEAFSPPAKLQPDFSGVSEGGFGLSIIEQSVDTVEYGNPMPGISSVRVVKRASAVAA